MTKAISDLKSKSDAAYAMMQINNLAGPKRNTVSGKADSAPIDFKVSGSPNIMMMEGFIDNAMEKVAESSSGGVGGGAPEPEDPNEKEKDFKVNDKKAMAVSQDAVHGITEGAREKQADFVAMYENIRKKIENGYGKGNGDYEVFDDLYDMVPNRLPVNETTTALLT